MRFTEYIHCKLSEDKFVGKKIVEDEDISIFIKEWKFTSKAVIFFMSSGIV